MINKHKVDILIKDIYDDIKLLNSKKESIKSETLKSILDEIYELCLNIYDYLTDATKRIKKQIKAFNANNSLNSERISKFISVNSELSKFNNSEDSIEFTGEINNLYKKCLEDEARTNNFYIYNSITYLYKILLYFFLAINVNDYNKSKEIKKSILDFGKTLISLPVGNATLIFDIPKHLAEIVNSTDDNHLITEFIELTDNNLCKLENQRNVLKMVLDSKETFDKLLDRTDEIIKNQSEYIEKHSINKILEDFDPKNWN